MNKFLNALRPAVAPTVADRTAMKRIGFEAQTLTFANLRIPWWHQMLLHQRRLHQLSAVRALRVSLYTFAWPGSQWTFGAYCFYDSFPTMMDSGELKYIPPNRCLTRQQEIAGSKPEKQIKLDKLDDKKTGLVIKEAEPEREASDLSLFQAMCRRGLTMDLVGFASFVTVMRWTNRMFTMYTQPPK